MSHKATQLIKQLNNNVQNMMKRIGQVKHRKFLKLRQERDELLKPPIDMEIEETTHPSSSNAPPNESHTHQLRNDRQRSGSRHRNHKRDRSDSKSRSRSGPKHYKGNHNRNHNYNQHHKKHRSWENHREHRPRPRSRQEPKFKVTFNSDNDIDLDNLSKKELLSILKSKETTPNNYNW